MLILERSPKESINIGDDVVVTILKINGDHVHVGIKAPKEIAVHREEVYERIAEQNAETKKPSPC